MDTVKIIHIDKDQTTWYQLNDQLVPLPSIANRIDHIATKIFYDEYKNLSGLNPFFTSSPPPYYTPDNTSESP